MSPDRNFFAGKLGGMENLDTLISRYIGIKTPREIASMAGVDVADVLRRKTELIDEVDVLSLSEKRAKIMIELQDLARSARDKVDNIDDEFYAGTVNAIVNAQAKMLQQLEYLEKKDADSVDQLNWMRVRELLRLMDVVVASGVREIASEHGLDEAELSAVFSSKLVEEAERLELGQ